MRIRPALVLPFAALAAFAGDQAMVGSLEWRPTSTLAESIGALNLLPLEGARIWVEPFTDNRADKDLLGENQERPETLVVKTRDDVAAFLCGHTAQLFKDAGLPMAAKADVATTVVTAEVMRYKVIEKDTYKGELNLMLQVRVGGKLLWKGVAMGEATRWGRSFKMENYQEVLSDCLIDAVGKVLKSPAFLHALAGKAEANH
ncbi:MAG TPA: hypothetical protein VJ600_09535 [Holophagaceae bacterium]|nr:hypothetical protein [Holophagaceae bacterium]